ncbi:MAG: hypothetical protein WCI73_19935, partial [Phycisphaerae bacterium]
MNHRLLLFPYLRGLLRPASSLLLLLGLAASGKTEVPSAAAPAKPRIALVMKSLANEFFATMADGAR